MNNSEFSNCEIFIDINSRVESVFIQNQAQDKILKRDDQCMHYCWLCDKKEHGV